MQSVILSRAKRLFRFQARLRLIQLAAGDYARKYLIGNPLLAQPGEKGYDPDVEREVKAALLHKQPETAAAAARRAKELKETRVSEHGVHYKKDPVTGETIAVPGQISKPYQRIKGEIRRQQKNIIEFPKVPEAPPPEVFIQHEGWRGGVAPEQKKPTPAKGSSYEGSHDPGELWDPTKAKSPGIKFTPTSVPIAKQGPLRKEWTSEMIRKNALRFRDPMASHLAGVEAGVIPSSVKRAKTYEGEGKIGAKAYLPLGVAHQERVNAQAIRDALAEKLKTLRRDVIQPLRVQRRQELGLPPVVPKTKGWKAFYKRSNKLGALEIARGSKFTKPEIKPTVSIAGMQVHPRVIARAHQELEKNVGEITDYHKNEAAKIKQEVHDLAQTKLSKSAKGRNLQNSVKTAVGNIFTHEHGDLRNEIQVTRERQHKGGAGIESEVKVRKERIVNEARDVAGYTGKSQDWVRQKHAAFLHHSFLGETQAGEDEIRNRIRPESFAKTILHPPSELPSGFPGLKKLGRRAGLGLGIAGAIGGTAYLLHRRSQRKNEMNREKQFSADDDALRQKYNALLKQKLAMAKQKAETPSSAHDIATGAVEGGLGVLATDPLLHKIRTGTFSNPFQGGPKAVAKNVAIGALVGGAATGLVGYGLSKFLPKRPDDDNNAALSSKFRSIKFDDTGSGVLYPRKRGKKLTVAQDKYRKQIKQQEIDRMEANLSKSTLAGAAVGGLLGRSRLATGIGAGAGLATQAALIARSHKERDVYGDRPFRAKQEERLPWQVGGLGAASIAGTQLYRKFKLAAMTRPIQFAQTITTEPERTPYYERQIKGFLEHPTSRVERSTKWIKRVGRIHKDLRAERTKEGNIIDERGRERTPEWKKPWVKTALGTGVAVGGLLLARKGLARTGKRLAVAAELNEKGIPWNQEQRWAMNLGSGNVMRAAKSKLKEMFPRMASGVERVGGIRSELREAKSRLLERANKAVEARTGEITEAKIKRSSETGEPIINKRGQFTIDINNPAERKENLEKLQRHKEDLKAKLDQAERAEHKAKQTGGTRAMLEEIKHPKKKSGEPPVGLSSKSGLIRFQDEVIVRPHTRRARRPKHPYEKKHNIEGFLIGAGSIGGLAGTGYGIRYGLNRQAAKAAAGEKFKRDVEEEVAKHMAAHEAAIEAQRLARIVRASAKLDSLLEFFVT